MVAWLYDRQVDWSSVITSLSIWSNVVKVVWRRFECLHHKPVNCYGVTKELSALGYNYVTSFLGNINTETWPSKLGKSPICYSKICSWFSWDSKLRMTSLSRPYNNCILQTRPIIRGDARLQQTQNYLRVTKSAHAPQMAAWHQECSDDGPLAVL